MAVTDEDLKMSELWKLQSSLPDSEVKTYLNDALNELSAYRRCGSVEDCQSRLEWMTFSMEDVRKKFLDFVRIMREEVEEDRKYATGRKRK